MLDHYSNLVQLHRIENTYKQYSKFQMLVQKLKVSEAQLLNKKSNDNKICKYRQYDTPTENSECRTSIPFFSRCIV